MKLNQKPIHEMDMAEKLAYYHGLPEGEKPLNYDRMRKTDHKVGIHCITTGVNIPTVSKGTEVIIMSKDLFSYHVRTTEQYNATWRWVGENQIQPIK